MVSVQTQQDPSCLIFRSAPNPTLTTHITHQHTTLWSFNKNDLLIRRSTHWITECRSLCLTLDSQPSNCLMPDLQCTSSWIQQEIQVRPFEVRSLCVHSVLWAIKPHPLNASMHCSHSQHLETQNPEALCSNNLLRL